MAEISKVFKGVSFTDSLENYFALKNVSICQFLFFLDIGDIAQYIKCNFYSDKDWHFRYNVEAMIKLVVVKFFGDTGKHRKAYIQSLYYRNYNGVI